MYTILIVDDVKMNRRLLRKYVNHYYNDNINIMEATNGFEAINMFVEHKPDLIFMDIVMPHCNGIEAITQIRHYENHYNLNHVPIIINSAGSTDTIQNINKILYHEKPISYNDIKILLQTCLKGV